MILESIFSCTNLLLISGFSIRILVKHSYDHYSKLLAHFACASVGIATIATRSFIVFVYKLFVKTYALDPVTMEMEEETDRRKLNILDELLGTIGMAALIYSLYSCHGYYVLGIFVAAGLSIFDALKLRGIMAEQPQESAPFHSEESYNSRVNIFSWVIFSGYFAYAVGNNYAVVANYPLLLANWALNPEGFYQGWTIRRAINDYLMAAYVICIAEALRQAQPS